MNMLHFLLPPSRPGSVAAQSKEEEAQLVHLEQVQKVCVSTTCVGVMVGGGLVQK